MALQPADHYVVTGQGIDATIDTSSINGSTQVTVTVDGHTLGDPVFGNDALGLSIRGNISSVSDGPSVDITVVLPSINIESDSITAPGFAVLTITENNIGGPLRVKGALQSHSIRPLAVRASFVEGIA